jgi:formamidopyrimidine-DNA glycosylase
MPELPEVETVRRGLEPAMTQRRIATVDQQRPDLRFPFPDQFADQLQGALITRLDRRAKYLLIHIKTRAGVDMVWLSHLGMTGRFAIEREQSSTQPGQFHNQADGGAHRHLILQLDDATRIVYIDPRRFGFMDLLSTAELARYRGLKNLGPEPDADLTPEILAPRLAGKKTPIKSALLDQRVISGLGNIYVCEALFRAGISPRRQARTIGTQRLARLVPAIIAVIEEAIAAGGSTLRDFKHEDGSLGYFQHRFAVYDRADAPCSRDGCGGTIRRIVQAGRSSFYCGQCQK